jgi:hypothetical protein
LALILILVYGIGFHFYRRYEADFFYINGKIKPNTSWKFYEERYEILKNGFRVEKGNFFIYSEEVFEGSYFTYRLRVLGFPVKYRKVDYSNYPKEICWGFPGVPGSEWHKGWFSLGRERFKEYLPQVELYRKKYLNKSSKMPEIPTSK